VPDLQTSSLEFFEAIEMALRAKQVEVQSERIQWHEGGILSANREYLRLSYARFVFDISAFPFGRDYQFSWWHGRKAPRLFALFGCLGVLAVPVAFLICVMIAGAIAGTLLFLVAIGVGLFMLAQNLASGDSELGEALVALPYVGPVIRKLFNPITYYSEDTRIMFEDTVHRVVLDVVGGILVGHNMSPLATEEQSPTRNLKL
jgi:hypothetical protein